jgi:hypothetical protein
MKLQPLKMVCFQPTTAEPILSGVLPAVSLEELHVSLINRPTYNKLVYTEYMIYVIIVWLTLDYLLVFASNSFYSSICLSEAKALKDFDYR